MTTFKNLTPWIALLAINWLFQLFIVPSLNSYYAIVLLNCGINIVLAVSLNLVNGFTGQFSMGHAGFMAVGAYASAMLTVTLKSKMPELFPYAIPQGLEGF